MPKSKKTSARGHQFINQVKKAEASDATQRIAKVTVPDLEKLFTEAPIGLCLIDKELRFAQVNEHLAEINGLPVAAHIGKSIYEISPDIAEIVGPIYRRVVETGKPVLAFEVRGVMSANPKVERCFHANYYPIKGDDGQVRFVGTIMQDITERKRIEMELRFSEQRFKTICENAPIMIDSFDDQGRCSLWNKQCEKVLGWTQEEINAHDDPLSLAYPDLETRNRVFETIKNADGVFREYKVKAKDGSNRVTMWADFRLPNKELISVGFDITEHKRTEKALKKSEELYRTLAENAQDLIYIVDYDGGIKYINKYSADFLGIHADEIVGKSLEDIFPPSIHLQRQKDNLQKVFKSAKPLHVDGMVQFQGQGLWLDTRLIPLESDEGKVTAVLGISRDISKLKETEMGLRTTNEELEEFAHVVSHDLKTPLKALSDNIKELSTLLTEKKDRRYNNFLNAISTDVQRMQNLIDEILEYSRLDALRDKVIRVNLNSLVLQIIKSISPPKNFKIKITTKLPTIWCEKIRIQEVFQNLIMNAIEQNDKQIGRIFIDCQDNTDYWKFSISDNGPGVKKEDYTRIFKRFYKVNPKSKGTGLGLALVKNIIQKYGGQIWVESEVGSGTTFFFTLPK